MMRVEFFFQKFFDVGFLLTTRVSNLVLLPMALPVRGLLCPSAPLRSAPGNLDKCPHMLMVLGLMEDRFDGI